MADRPGFFTVTTVEFDASAAQTWLDFLGDVESVTGNGVSVPVEYDGARIAPSGLAEHNTVTVRAVGHYSRSGEGLHRFVDPVDGQTYLYTQYEPADARRVFTCFEQPDLKAPFVFEVTASQGWLVCSNRTVTSWSRRRRCGSRDGADLHLHHGGGRGTVPLGSNPLGAVTIWWSRSV